MKEGIGHKSAIAIGLNLFLSALFAVFLLFVVIGFKLSQDLMLYVLQLAIVAMAIYQFKRLSEVVSQPETLIVGTAEGFELHLSKSELVRLPYVDVKRIELQAEQHRSAMLSYGEVVFHTDEQSYSIPNVAKLDVLLKHLKKIYQTLELDCEIEKSVKPY